MFRGNHSRWCLIKLSILFQISALSGDTALNWRPDSSSTATTAVNSNISEPTQPSSIPTATEVNPSIYDELKLGHKGAGFKRLVS